MSFFWLIPIFAAVLVAIKYKNLRFRMVLAALLIIPILLVKPLTSPNFFQIIAGKDLIVFLIWRLLITASLAALVMAIYEVFIHKKICPILHPLRPKFIWLLSGLLATAILLISDQSFIVAVLVGLAIDLIIILILRWDLVWDAVFSGFSMGILYLIAFLLTFRGFPGEISNLWFTNTISGITLWSLPIEELLAVVLFGSLFGPIYIALKCRSKGNENTFSSTIYNRQSKLKIVFSLSIMALMLLAILLAVYFFVLPPKVSAITPKNDSSGAGLIDDISIKFNKPINREAIDFLISPDVTGRWHFSDSTFSDHLFKQANFTPDQPLVENQVYTVRVTNAYNFTRTFKSKDFQSSFRTQTAPKIDRASIVNGQTDVALGGPISIYLDQKNNRLVDFSFQFEPQVDFVATISDNSTEYNLNFEKPLVQGVVYKLSARGLNLFDLGSAPEQNHWEITFTTKQPPGLIQYSPQGDGVLTDTKTITLDFAQPMVQEESSAHVSLNPEPRGNWQWQTPAKLVYNLQEKLQFATTYNIVVTKDFHDQQGGFITNDINVGFNTIGKVRVDNFTPKNNLSNVPTNSDIAITFNQAVNQLSAQRSFTISPNTSGSFSWSENSMIFSPNGLNKDSTYTINLAAGVKSLNGLDSDQNYSASFSTIKSLTVLNIPQDYQDRSLSCEAAALKMALNYRGAGVSENDIMARIGFDPTIRSGNTWGNPHNAFVGDIDGRQNTTGYGVYWDPIAKAANAWRKASSFSGWSVNQIAQAIADDNPVVLWGIYGSGYRDDWQTPDGQTILAWKGEHARTVIGFSGSVENPTSFIINDPNAGRIVWSTDRLKNDMATFGASGVVVY